jgi:ParB family chromosome partitioning protein
MSKRVLGKGLKALIPDRLQIERTEMVELPIKDILANPFQPRSRFDQEKLEELAKSIKEKGVIQPVIVRPRADGKYELIAGERRLKAAVTLNFKKIPALIKHVNNEESLELSLIENIQREELNLIDQAKAYRQLMQNFKLTQEKLAEKLGKDRASVANILRLLKLPREIQLKLSRGEISFGHAKVLLSLSNREKQILLAQKIVDQNLSVREIEKILKKEPTFGEEKRRKKEKELEILNLENQLREKFKTKVEIKKSGEKGKIEIRFFSEEDLLRIMEILGVF